MMHHSVKVGDRVVSPIDWEMTPELTFGTYESWGGRERVRNNDEQVYYFFIDGWGDDPKVCLMERAVKHAKILAEVDVPMALVESCVSSQGKVALFERTYAVDENIKKWLIEHVVEGDGSRLRPVVEKVVRENMGSPLFKTGEVRWEFVPVSLPSSNDLFVEEDLEKVIKKWNFYDGAVNPDGRFANGLTDPGDGLTVVDERTDLQWQVGGLDICSNRMMRKRIEKLNEVGFAELHDWRMPTMEEALSLLEPKVNAKNIHLNPCFSMDQPFIFVAARRKPGGYWFVDFKHGRSFWSSGTIPGAFGRLCRSRS